MVKRPLALFFSFLLLLTCAPISPAQEPSSPDKLRDNLRTALTGFQSALQDMAPSLDAMANKTYGGAERLILYTAMSEAEAHAKEITRLIPEMDEGESSAYQALNDAFQAAVIQEKIIWQDPELGAEPRDYQPLLDALTVVTDRFKELFSGLDAEQQAAMGSRMEMGSEEMRAFNDNLSRQMNTLGEALRSGPRDALVAVNNIFRGGLGLPEASEGVVYVETVVRGPEKWELLQAEETAREEARKKKGFILALVPALDAEDDPEESGPPGYGRTLQWKEAFLAAAAQIWPVADAATRNFNVTHREVLQVSAATAGRAWMNRYGKLLQHYHDTDSDWKSLHWPDPSTVPEKLEAVTAAGLSPEERRKKFKDAQEDLSFLLGRSPTGRAEHNLLARSRELNDEIKRVLEDYDNVNFLYTVRELRKELREVTKGLKALQEEDPQYFEVRALLAEQASFVREHAAEFPDGTRFSGEELGLSRHSIYVKETARGKPGFTGLSYGKPVRFKSFDGTLTREYAKDGRAIERWIEDKKLIVTTYDKDQNVVDAVTFVPEGEDGFYLSSSEQKPWPKFLGRFQGKQGFIYKEVRHEDGSRSVQQGDEAPGVVTLIAADGTKEWKLDASRLLTLPDRKRAAELVKITGWIANERGDKYRGDEIDAAAAMIYDLLRNTRNQETSFSFLPDGRIVGSRGGNKKGRVTQVIAKWEDSKYSDRALALYARSASAGETGTKGYFPVRTYIDGYSSTKITNDIKSTTDDWHGGYLNSDVTVTPTRRFYRRKGGQERTYPFMIEKWKESKLRAVELKTISVMDGPDVLDALAHSVSAFGKGMTDVISAGLAASIAYSPAGLVAAAVSEDLSVISDNLKEQAKTDFLGNAVNRAIFGEDRLKEDFGIKDEFYIQNVGKIASDHGHEELGAVLQGAVEYNNFLAPMGAMFKGMQFLGKIPRIGGFLVQGTGLVMAGKGGYDSGVVIGDFYNAVDEYDSNDVASQQRYYSALQNITQQTLTLPMTIGGLNDVYRGRFPAAAKTAPVVRTGAPEPDVPNAKTNKRTVVEEENLPPDTEADIESFGKKVKGEGEPGPRTERELVVDEGRFSADEQAKIDKWVKDMQAEPTVVREEILRPDMEADLESSMALLREEAGIGVNKIKEFLRSEEFLSKSRTERLRLVEAKRLEVVQARTKRLEDAARRAEDAKNDPTVGARKRAAEAEMAGKEETKRSLALRNNEPENLGETGGLSEIWWERVAARKRANAAPQFSAEKKTLNDEYMAIRVDASGREQAVYFWRSQDGDFLTIEITIRDMNAKIEGSITQVSLKTILYKNAPQNLNIEPGEHYVNLSHAE